MKSFCIQCRKEFKSSHVTPFHEFVCGQTGSAVKEEAKPDSTIERVSWFKVVGGVLGVILAIPFLAVLGFPYVMGKNFLEFSSRLKGPRPRSSKDRLKIFERRVSKKRFGFAALIIAVVFLALAPIVTIYLYLAFVLGACTLSRKKRLILT